jgi:hypothetical protein
MKITNKEMQEYDIRQNLIKYYNLTPNMKSLHSYQQFYTYLESLLSNFYNPIHIPNLAIKLWNPTQFSPLAPFGLVRLI